MEKIPKSKKYVGTCDEPPELLAAAAAVKEESPKKRLISAADIKNKATNSGAILIIIMLLLGLLAAVVSSSSYFDRHLAYLMAFDSASLSIWRSWAMRTQYFRNFYMTDSSAAVSSASLLKVVLRTRFTVSYDVEI